MTIWLYFKPFIEIFILWIVFYRILLFFEGTRAFQVLKGISYLLIAFLLSQILGLNTINWLLTKLFGLSIIALLIIFQQELRQGLARLGQQHLFSLSMAESEIMLMIEKLSVTIFKLSRRKVGCLIAIEKEIKLRTYIESGVSVDSSISAELLQSIFMPKSPLHDGGVIISAGRVVAASCLFPLSENDNLSRILGTRHRAALGITEQTDAICLIVSEETGEISIAFDGRFIPVTHRERFTHILKDLLMKQEKKKS